MGFKSTFNNLDLLKIPISLSYKDKYLYRTHIGATLTMIGFIIIIVYIIIKFTEIIEKSSFSIISNEYQNPLDSINFTNVPILFAMTDADGNPLDLNKKLVDFSVVFSEYVQNFDEKGNSHMVHIEKEIEIERCDKLRTSFDLSYFDGYNISSFKCIKPFQYLSLKGIYGDINGYRSIKINLKKCNNLKENCFDNDYIDSIISNSRFVVIYIGYKTNFYNSDKKDIERTILTRSITLSSFFSKRVYLYMSLVKYIVYDNIFINNKKETKYFINRDMRLEYVPIKEVSINDNFYNGVYAFFTFVFDGNVIEYTKKVEKFGECISYIGNLFNIVLTLFRIINNYFSNKILFIDIFYHFFFDEKFKNKKIQFNNSKPYNLSKNLNTINLNMKSHEKSNNSNMNSNLNFNEVIEDKSIENPNHNFSFLNNTNKTKIKTYLSVNSKNYEIEKNNFLKSKLYYLYPLCFIKKKKKLKHIIPIEKIICNTFSIENFIEFIKTSKNIYIFKKEYLYEKKRILPNKNIKVEINKILNYK